MVVAALHHGFQRPSESCKNTGNRIKNFVELYSYIIYRLSIRVRANWYCNNGTRVLGVLPWYTCTGMADAV